MCWEKAIESHSYMRTPVRQERGSAGCCPCWPLRVRTFWASWKQGRGTMMMGLHHTLQTRPGSNLCPPRIQALFFPQKTLARRERVPCMPSFLVWQGPLSHQSIPVKNSFIHLTPGPAGLPGLSPEEAGCVLTPVRPFRNPWPHPHPPLSSLAGGHRSAGPAGLGCGQLKCSKPMA